MSYKDRFGITEIKDSREILSINYEEENQQKYPVLLYVPNKEEFTHYHIELSRKEASLLKDWLEDFLKDNP